MAAFASATQLAGLRHCGSRLLLASTLPLLLQNLVHPTAFFFFHLPLHDQC